MKVASSAMEVRRGPSGREKRTWDAVPGFRFSPSGAILVSSLRGRAGASPVRQRKETASTAKNLFAIALRALQATHSAVPESAASAGLIRPTQPREWSPCGP